MIERSDLKGHEDRRMTQPGFVCRYSHIRGERIHRSLAFRPRHYRDCKRPPIYFVVGNNDDRASATLFVADNRFKIDEINFTATDGHECLFGQQGLPLQIPR